MDRQNKQLAIEQGQTQRAKDQNILLSSWWEPKKAQIRAKNIHLSGG